MFIIKYLNTNTNKVLVEELVAKKATTAKNWANQFVAHHTEFKVLSIQSK